MLTRSVTLPTGAEEADVNATYVDGNSRGAGRRQAGKKREAKRIPISKK
jgi:hypothetical protein